MTKVGMDVEKLKPLYIVGGNVKQGCSYGKEYICQFLQKKSSRITI